MPVSWLECLRLASLSKSGYRWGRAAGRMRFKLKEALYIRGAQYCARARGDMVTTTTKKMEAAMG